MLKHGKQKPDDHLFYRFPINMKIAVLGCHASVQGGGWMATKWHLLALRDLGHEVTHLTTMKPHPTIRKSWGQEMQGIGLAGIVKG